MSQCSSFRGKWNLLFQRIEGGSESPTPNDDVSVHSASDCGFDQISALKQVHLLQIFRVCGKFQVFSKLRKIWSIVAPNATDP